jgi:hypothetical protein
VKPAAGTIQEMRRIKNKGITNTIEIMPKSTLEESKTVVNTHERRMERGEEDVKKGRKRYWEVV